MTPLQDVFMISVTDNLDFDHLKAIYTSGYTRIPVYHNREDCIVGIVFTKVWRDLSPFPLHLPPSCTPSSTRPHHRLRHCVPPSRLRI